MVEVPRYMDHHERAAQLPLVTDRATVTRIRPMDRNRNGRVRATIREHLEDVDCRGALDEIRDGADYDWDALWDRLDDAAVSDSRADALQTLAERFERPYPSLLELRARPDVDVDFVPGQYVTVRAEDTPRPYSLATPPTADELAFAIRHVPGGRFTGDLFTSVSEGDEVVVRGPNGEMLLESPSKRDVVFLATGTGVAPFKSMIEYLFEQGWDEYDGRQRDVWLILGCGWVDDLPYREAFRDLYNRQENFHFVPTLSREALLSDWSGETDYVQQVFVKHLVDGALDGVDLPERLEPFRDDEPVADRDARIDPDGVDLYACGITAMVKTLVRAARAVGVPETHMQYEGFG